MSRGRKIGMIIGGSILGLVLAVVITGVIIVQTQWFRDTVRTKIISAVEEATGGKVEIRRFSFDWRRLHAAVDDFVIHGLEPAGAAPLFRAKTIEIDLKLLSPFKGMIDLAYLGIDTPQANIIIFPDGRTNIPEPKIKKKSDKTGLETIVDLAIRKFNLTNGSVMFAEQKTDFNAAGENLRAQLAYNIANPGYTGEIDISPLNLRSGNNTPVNVDVKLPITAERDKITVADAHFTTPQSQIVLSGSMEHLLDPRSSAHINAKIALDEVKRVAGLSIPLDSARGPGILTADVTATMDKNYIRLTSARMDLGHSNIEASGTLKDPNRPATVQFNSTLALGEIGRLFRVAVRPEGTVKIGGNAALRPNNDYLITANVDARNVAITQGTTRLTGIALDTSVTADPHRIHLGGLRLAALSGGFNGSAVLENMDRFHVAGNLHNFDIQQVMRAFSAKPPGYDGIISGPVDASGSIKQPKDLVARANLAIAPGPRGVPVSGRINANYNGRADTVTLGRSYIALPNTRVDLAGSLGQQIQVHLVSRNLNDFRPLAPSLPVVLERGGAAKVDATVTGKLSAPKIAAQVAVNNFAVEGRPFTRLNATLAASNSGATVSNGVLARGPLAANFDGSVGLRNWKPENSEPLRANVTMRNADLADVLALAGQSSVPATGALTADVHVNGTIGDPQGNAELTVLNGTLEGERFDRLATRVVMTPGLVNMPVLELVAGPSRIDANATYQHPRDDLKRGTLRAHVASNQVQLAQFQSLVKDRPGLRGVLTLNADVAATVAPSPAGTPAGTNVQLTAADGNLAVRGMQMEGKNLGDFTAVANTAGNAVQYRVNSDFAGSTIRVNGSTMLAADHRTTANAVINNLPIESVLAVAGKRDLPVAGSLAATAQVSGTLNDVRGTANLNVTKGSAYDEKFDRLQATIGYSPTAVDVSNFEFIDGGNTLTMTASFNHPANDFQNGKVQFRVNSNAMQLTRFETVERAKPGLGGVLQIVADGAATLRKNATPVFSALNANIGARGISLNGKPLGEASVTAQTSGQEVNFQLKSDLARANIAGSGTMGLSTDHPVNAKVTFSNVTYSGLSPLIGGATQPVDASAEGEVQVSGPLARTEDLRGSFRLTKLEAHSLPAGPTGAKPRVTFDLHNQGPIVVALDRSVVKVESAHLVGTGTKLDVTGTASLRNPESLDVRASGNVNLEMLEAFSPDIFSSGAIVLNAAVTGTPSKPVVNGRLQLQNASLHTTAAPNGLTNGNGTIAFTGTEAIIQNITGETGGGKVTLAGYISYGGPEMQFRIQATADGVRVETPQNVTVQADAQVTWAGTTSRSLASGTVTILDVALHSHSDIGAMLTTAAAPVSTPTVSTGILAGIHFDIRIETATNVQFRTTLTQNLQADARLTLRGTVDHPGMLGRVVVTRGKVVFFGYKYSIDQGTVSFYDPQKINPYLNIDLSTTAQGVDVALSVSGPMDKLKFTYRSDPPMQFSDLVALLASGSPPTTDPVLAARAPIPPEQNLEQKGASAVLGQAVANPVSDRLQRLFGVTALKIDPQIVGSSATPQATLTLQQQITPEISFTYIQNVSQSNPQIIRVEWAIDPRWSAIAQRDLNGMFDLDFFYKKRFW